MNTNSIIKNTVLGKLFTSLHTDRLTEIWENGQRYTLETEYRLTVTETGNAIYTITQTYREHYDCEISGGGRGFRYSHRTRTWEQEEGKTSSIYRYNESLRERKSTDPDGPWELKHLESQETTNPDDLPQIQDPRPEQGWQKSWGALRLGELIQREKLVTGYAIKALLKLATEHTR